MNLKKIFQKREKVADTKRPLKPQKNNLPDELVVTGMVEGLKRIYQGLKEYNLSGSERENFLNSQLRRLEMSANLRSIGYDQTNPYHTAIMDYFFAEGEQKKRQADHLVSGIGPKKIKEISGLMRKNRRRIKNLLEEALKRLKSEMI